ncbi:MAG: DNA repair protein RadA [Humidesulfovibrio sp.]|jgi:DNA repair protein RadA/Sms|uniref:DNA repair protein RadA n=1 Tax=Humidesulfovibrio sp. TaxID=2910988 RepID=UPI00273274A4|nr:DNA repair protein RadA [Humidesulfovibrio sp.]MDP2849317.1 DNA repair protein RadA [Humidesulfovibrio sp.]
MAKQREEFLCSACGAKSPRWTGQCSGCGEWNTMQVVAASSALGGWSARGTGKRLASLTAPEALEDLGGDAVHARPTGIPALDGLLGSGLVPGAALLLGGEPGVGKSTLLLQLAACQADLGQKSNSAGPTVYVSGEESLAQIRSRANRLGLLGPGLLALATNNADEALNVVADMGTQPGLIIVDSVQTLASPRAEGIPGSVSQVRAVAGELVEAVKRSQATLVLVGHVTKDGQIAGPKLLEHMVDTVLYLEGDRRDYSRVLRVLKNRFGPSDELLVFTMEEKGLSVVDDPSTFFLGARDATLSGAAVSVAMDGQRPFAVEIQALATKSFLAIPRRAALGFDANRLHLLLAVLEKRLKLPLGQFDIYVKQGGGLALRDPGLDLGLAAAVLSSYYDAPLPEGAVFWGELDLNGHVRPVAGHETRLKQASRLGYAPLLHSGTCKTLDDLRRALFGKAQA